MQGGTQVGGDHERGEHWPWQRTAVMCSWKMEARAHSWLHTELEASLRFMRPWRIVRTRTD